MQPVWEVAVLWGKDTGRSVKPKTGGAHTMQRVVFLPDREGFDKGLGATITTKKPWHGPHCGMRLWAQGQPGMVSLMQRVVESSRSETGGQDSSVQGSSD